MRLLNNELCGFVVLTPIIKTMFCAFARDLFINWGILIFLLAKDSNVYITRRVRLYVAHKGIK